MLEVPELPDLLSAKHRHVRKHNDEFIIEKEEKEALDDSTKVTNKEALSEEPALCHSN